jgi:hypothetical protein
LEAIEEYMQWHNHKPQQAKAQLLRSCFTNPSLLNNELNQKNKNKNKWMHHEWYPKAHGYLGPWGAVCFGFRHSS